MTKALYAGPRDKENCCSFDSCLRTFQGCYNPIWHSALHWPCPDIELQSQCVHDFDNGGKAGVALFAQSLVKPFAIDAGVPGQLHLAARQCNITHGFGERCSVFWRFVHADL